MKQESVSKVFPNLKDYFEGLDDLDVRIIEVLWKNPNGYYFTKLRETLKVSALRLEKHLDNLIDKKIVVGLKTKEIKRGMKRKLSLSDDVRNKIDKESLFHKEIENFENRLKEIEKWCEIIEKGKTEINANDTRNLREDMWNAIHARYKMIIEVHTSLRNLPEALALYWLEKINGIAEKYFGMREKIYYYLCTKNYMEYLFIPGKWSIEDKDRMNGRRVIENLEKIAEREFSIELKERCKYPENMYEILDWGLYTVSSDMFKKVIHEIISTPQTKTTGLRTVW